MGVGLVIVLVQLAVLAFVLVMLFRLVTGVERIGDLLEQRSRRDVGGPDQHVRIGQHVRYEGRPRDRVAEDGVRETLSPGRQGEVVGRVPDGRLAVRFDGFGIVECGVDEVVPAPS